MYPEYAHVSTGALTLAAELTDRSEAQPINRCDVTAQSGDMRISGGLGCAPLRALRRRHRQRASTHPSSVACECLLQRKRIQRPNLDCMVR
jgi:hypothetical protein